MEVVVTLVVIYIIWRIIKYVVGTVIHVDRLYHALKDIRITTFTNQNAIYEVFSMDYIKGGEDDIKKAIGIIIVSTLKNSGYRVEYIPGNYKLQAALMQAIDDIYEIVEERRSYQDIFKG